MHVPDSMLNGAVCPVTAGLALVGLAAAAVAAAKSEHKPTVARFAAVAALIFGGQMLNVAVDSGTSGHLLGAVLAAVLLGTPFAVLAMSLVLAVQALVFGDGGMLALGANVLNMALVGVGTGGLLRALISRHSAMAASRRTLLLVGGGWLSVMLAALAVSLELTVSGAGSLANVAGAMLSTHAWIGLGEGLLTAALYFVLAPGSAMNPGAVGAGRPLALASGALLLSPWASRLPDGLERVAGQLGLLSGAAGGFAPLADYSLPSIGHPQASVILAGFCGGLLVFGCAWLLGSRLARRLPAHVQGR